MRHAANALLRLITPAAATPGPVLTMGKDSALRARQADAAHVVGTVALPGNTVCAIKRTVDGHVAPAGTVPY